MDRFPLFAAASLIAFAALAGGAHSAERTAAPTVTETAAAPRSSKLPVAARVAIQRAKLFNFVMRRPSEATGETLILLHGSGGDETTLMPLASRIAPHSVLMGVAGRITQEGKKRWYERITPVTFVQEDIRAEADAFADFIVKAVKAEKIDLGRTTFVGYSNGANLLAALALLHPGLVERAVLLRPMPVLESVPASDLARTRILTVVGASDATYAPFGPALQEMLRGRGAKVDARLVERGHGLGDEDVRAVAEWLATSHTMSMNQ